MSSIRRKFKGFTVVEIFIVLSIIAVLSAFLAAAALKALQKKKNVATCVLLDNIAAALEMYKGDFGTYPPDNYPMGDDARSLHYFLGATFRRLASAPMNSDINAGPYILFSVTNTASSSGSSIDFDGDGATDDTSWKIIDAWGHPLHYDSSSPTNNINSYDLSSDGPNGVNNSGYNDDISNWN